jgi:hypothetical protein
MKTGRLGRIAGMAALALLALGALGYVVNGSDGVGNETSPAGGVAMSYEDGAGASFDADVMMSIDQALGRESSVMTQVAPAGPPLADARLPGSPPVADQAPSKESTGAIAGGGAPDNQPMAALDDRKIVQTATLKLQVDEVGASFEEVGRIATAAGGFIASSNFALLGEDQVASLTIRVPADRYQDTLSQVRGLGVKVEGEGSNASDVTEEYADLQSRLRNLEASETRLLELLGRAQNINEVLQVQDRINNVRGEIERTLGRIALLDKLSDLATITVHLRPVAAGTTPNGGGTTLGNAIDEAWADSLAFLEDVAAGVLTVVVFAWWLPLVAIPCWVIGGRLLRRLSAPARPAAPVEGV